MEGRALSLKMTTTIWKFLLKGIIDQYGGVGKIVVGSWEMNENEDKEELFERLGVKLSLTIAYDQEAM